jgi:hypothetical protein
MEAISSVSGLLSLVQTFTRALESINNLSDSSLSDHRRLLSEYAVLMGVLKHCVSVIQNSHEGPLLQTVLYVADQCWKIGQDLATRNEKVIGKNGRKRIVYALASGDKLALLHTDFKFYVDTLHQLVQRSV